MILFWLCALALIIVALAMILPPLLGARRVRGEARSDSRDLEVYGARLASLEEECRLGALSADDLAEAKNELARELLAGAPHPGAAADPAGTTRPAPRRPWLAVAVGVGVPLLSIALYQRLGDPGALNPAPPGAGGQASVEDMVVRLAERLRAQPGNADGWLLLARSYMALSRYAEAEEAFAAAHRLLGDSPELLTNLAEAQALMNGRDFLGSPSEQLEQALALDPAYPKALWLGAFAALQRGDKALAVSRWQSLLDSQPDDSQASQILRGLIADAGGSAAAPTASDDTPAGGPTPGLTVNVVLADDLAAGLDGSETLFVFARAAQGPPMPLAVSRRRVSDLPLTVVLDDSMAMAPGMKLSNFPQVVVGARISKSGTPTASSGDLQGFSEPVAVSGAGTVHVSINQRVP